MFRTTIFKKDISKASTEVVVVPLSSDYATSSGRLRKAEVEQLPMDFLTKALGDGWPKELTARQFKASSAAETLTLSCSSAVSARYIVFVGAPVADAEHGTRTADYRQCGHSVAQQVSAVSATSLLCWGKGLELKDESFLQAFLEGIELAAYSFKCYKSEKVDLSAAALKEVALTHCGTSVSGQSKKARAVSSAIMTARNLVNTPPSDSSPADVLRAARSIASKSERLSITVYTAKKLEKMGAGGILGVGKGSDRPPLMVKLVYTPSAKKDRENSVALVGKGVTFDSGGYSIKSSAGMAMMKCDMAGAAAVLATMSALPALKPAAEVRAYLPLAENLISGRAILPGDVLKILNGKTVEVLNTDAEGRLLLADALSLASKEKPDMIIDLATLTGSCMVALGNIYAGLFSDNKALVKGLRTAAEAASERLWHLPLPKEYRSLLDSQVADVKNIGGPFGGAITAGLFLKEFVGDIPWAHLDIAGPAFLDSESGIAPRGATGFGVGTLLRFLTADK